MTKLTVYWLNPPLSTRAIYPDLGWMNFNTCMPEHNWIQPIVDWEAHTELETVIDHVMEHSPDVLCISTYAWNHLLCKAVAQRIKQLSPTTIVVRGGPHQGYNSQFFDLHPEVDYLCYATGHGETFLQQLLKQLAEHGTITAPSEVPYLISRTYQAPRLSQKYVYPTASCIHNNITYLMECVNVATHRNITSNILYETTRGCPYSCTYCEWGGGTSSKVSIKPLDLVKQEIQMIGILGFESMEFVNANFGIIEDDYAIANYIGEVKQATGCPKKVMLYGLAKTSVPKRERVLEALYQHELLDDYFVAIQTVSDKALCDVKRTDISKEDNLRLAEKFARLYNAVPHVEFLMGLPGYTLDDFYTELDYFHHFTRIANKSGWRKCRNVFSLLPNTPAAKPDYMEAYGIKAAFVGTADTEECDTEHMSNSIITHYRSSSRLVVETYSYTREQYKQMFVMNRAQRTVGLLIKPDAKASEFFRHLFDTMSKSEYYTVIDNHLELLTTGKLANVDPLYVEGRMIEDHIYEKYVLQHRELFDKWLDFTNVQCVAQ